LRLGQGLVDFSPVRRFQTERIVVKLGLALLLVGCGSEPTDSAVSETNQVTVAPPPAPPVAESVPAKLTPEPTLEPTLEPAEVPSLEPSLELVAANTPAESAVSDPLSLEPSLEPTGLGVTGGEGEESVDDILKQLNAIKLDDTSNTTLGDPDKVVKLLAEGNALAQAGDPAGALSKYRDALNYADGEGDPDVFFNMGIAHKAKGETDRAIAAYEKALKLAPEYSEAHNNLGNLLKNQKRFEEAIIHYEASIKIFPDNSNTHNNLGTVHAMRGDISKAETYFAKAVSIQPTYYEARQNLGLSYMQQGKLEEAEKEFATAVKMAEGGMRFEELRMKSAQNQLAKVADPSERQVAQSEISAAQKAGQIASSRYFRGKALLNRVLVKQGKPPQP